MYICESCGKTFNEMPTCCGGEVDEIVTDTCSCGGNISYAEKCECCGEYHSESDSTDGICDMCFKKCACIENVIAYAKDKNLMEELNEHIREFVLCDDDFTKWLKEKVL